MLRYITADYVFPISSLPIKNGVVVVDDSGIIQEVLTTTPPSLNSKLERYSGIICPGFINTHCHLELSHLKNVIPENQGMAGFIKNIVSKRQAQSKDLIKQAIADAELEMINNGIVAVGDISNDDSTFNQKRKNNLKYHTFFEVFNLDPSHAASTFEKALNLQGVLHSQPIILNSSITPHSPYSVSTELFKLIDENASKNNSIVSYHNQESLAESDLFISKNGDIAELFTEMKINPEFIPKTGLNSLRSTLINFSGNYKTLLVHNTYTTKADVLWAQNYFSNGRKGEIEDHNDTSQQPINNNLFWCFCPNANLYIENKLPNFQGFIDVEVICTIGTDSLASNHSLSILNELKVIAKHAHEIPLQTLLTWATLNGAVFLGLDTELGSIEKDKTPGLNLITNINLNTLQLTPESEVRKLI